MDCDKPPPPELHTPRGAGTKSRGDPARLGQPLPTPPCSPVGVHTTAAWANQPSSVLLLLEADRRGRSISLGWGAPLAPPPESFLNVHFGRAALSRMHALCYFAFIWRATGG